MTALPASTKPSIAPDTTGAVFEAVADSMVVAGTYANAAVDFASIKDARGLAYAVRSASAALLTAASLVEELRPPGKGGSRA